MAMFSGVAGTQSATNRLGPGPNGPAHGFVVSISETGGSLHYFQIGSGRDRGAVWMGGSSPVADRAPEVDLPHQ